MTRQASTAIWLSACLSACATTPPAATPDSELPAAAHVLSRHLGEVFRTRYAPAELKRRTLHWDVEEELAALDAAIDAQPKPSKAGLQQAFRHFFQSMHDIHTFVELADARTVWLGVHLMTTETGVRVAWVDPKLRQKDLIAVGDEVTRFGDEPAADAVRHIADIGLHSYNFPKADQQAAIRDFNGIIDTFIERGVDGLVIDERGNNGGNFLFAYALLARLFDRPLVPTPQHFLIRGDQVIGLTSRKELLALAAPLDAAKTDDQARVAIEAVPLLSDFFGFGPRDLKTARALSSFFHFFEQGTDGLTEPHYALVPELAPERRFGPIFTRPVLMLIDGMDISAADYTAATLRDNGRAMLFGETTSGAGGDQRRVGLDNVCTDKPPFFAPCAPRGVVNAMKALGINAFTYTVTLGERPGGRLIENVGVAPDFPYRITAEDLLSGFTPMRSRIIEALTGPR